MSTITNYGCRFTMEAKVLEDCHAQGLGAVNAVASPAVTNPGAKKFVEELGNTPPPDRIERFTKAGFSRWIAALHRRIQDENTRNQARILRFKQSVSPPGKPTLKIHMVDPTVVVMKIVIHDAPLPASDFGPPEVVTNKDFTSKT